MKYAVLTVLALSTCVIASCSLPGSQKSDSQSQSQSQTGGVYPDMYANMPKFDDVLSKVPQKVRELPDFQACAGQTIMSCTQSAAQKQATESKDLAWCDLIPDESSAKSCRETIAYTQAILTNDESACNKLATGHLNKSCHSRIVSAKAAEAQDISLCETLANKPLVASGALLSGALLPFPTSLDKESQYRYAEDCRMQVMGRMDRSKVSAALCDKMMTESGKKECLDFNNYLKSQSASGAVNTPQR